MSEKFNKRCALVLKWEYEYRTDIGEIFIVKKEEHLQWFTRNARTSFGGFRISCCNLRFHDSYDWAMLLVKKAAEKDWCKLADHHEIVNDLFMFVHSTPQQISQAALEVLESQS